MPITKIIFKWSVGIIDRFYVKHRRILYPAYQTPTHGLIGKNKNDVNISEITHKSSRSPFFRNCMGEEGCIIRNS